MRDGYQHQSCAAKRLQREGFELCSTGPILQSHRASVAKQVLNVLQHYHQCAIVLQNGISSRSCMVNCIRDEEN